jgi:hypothetical protein
MKRCTIIAICVLAVVANADTNEVHFRERGFAVHPGFLDVIVVTNDAPVDGQFVEMGRGRGPNADQAIEEFLASAGIPFPEGSSVHYDASRSVLRVRNTDENLRKLGRMLNRTCCVPYQVELTITMLRLPFTVDQLREPLSAIDALALTNAIVMNSLTAVSRSGVNAKGTSTIGAHSTSNWTSEVNFTPIVGPDGYTIDLTIVWFATFTAPEAGTANYVTREVVTSVAVHAGSAMVLHKAASHNSADIVIAQTRLLDSDGEPMEITEFD